MTTSGRLTVGLGEYDIGWHDPSASIAAADRLVERVAQSASTSSCCPRWRRPASRWTYRRPCRSNRRMSHALRQIATRQRCVARRRRRAARWAAVAAGQRGARHRSERRASPPSTASGGCSRYGGEDRAYTEGDRPTIVDISGVRVGAVHLLRAALSRSCSPRSRRTSTR